MGTLYAKPFKYYGLSSPVSTEIIAANEWRDIALPLATSHLRTCYAGLLRQVPLQDFLYQGKFYPVSGDIALFWPALEKAGYRTECLKDITYIYQETEINEYKIKLPLVLACYKDLRSKKRYQPVTDQELEQILQSNYKAQEADLIIFSYNRPLQLQALLASTQKYITGTRSISIIYRTDNDAFDTAYNQLKTQFPSAHFIKQSPTNPSIILKKMYFKYLKMARATT